MNKENVIFYVECLFMLVFAFLVIRHLGMFGGFPLLWETVLCMCVALVTCFLELWRERIISDKDPFGLKRIGFVLDKITKDMTGTKTEFVNEFGDEMYELFLKKGYIHELNHIDYKKNDFVWEVTKLGLRRKVELCS